MSNRHNLFWKSAGGRQTSTSLSISLVWVTILRFYETKEHFRGRTTQDDKLYKHTRHNSALDDHKKLPYESHLCKTSLWLLSWACCTGGSRLVVQTLVQYYPSTTSVTCLYPKSPTSPINHTWKRIKTKIWQRIQYCNILQVIWFIGNISWLYEMASA